MAYANHHGPSIHWRTQDKSLQLQHGPIELLIEAEGELQERQLAFEQVAESFKSVLTDLVQELPQLRAPINDTAASNDISFATVSSTNSNHGSKVLRNPTFSGLVAKRMSRSVQKHQNIFVTPMAAVAGAVADHLLYEMLSGRKLRKAFVNNGGDIAFHLDTSECFSIGICENMASRKTESRAHIDALQSVRGIATSGWQGRSHSLGIADSVTVLATCAADADVAATLIANEVALPENSSIERLPANEVSPDSDLGDRLVTLNVPVLSYNQIEVALQRGNRFAKSLCSQGLIDSAYIHLQGRTVVVGSHSVEKEQCLA